MMKSKDILIHSAALLVIFIWGTTFVSTKVLLNNGFNPASILFYRFLLGYIGILIFSYKTSLFAKSLKDELMFVLVGVFGGSLYYFTENLALDITLASNVALIVCINPLITALLIHIFSKKEKMSKNLLMGSLLAFAGVVLVVYNGNFKVDITVIGELIAFIAAVSWSLYTLLLRHFSGRYSSLFITRKVLFYGIITILPAFLWKPLTTDISLFFQPVVWGNMLFLGLGASLFCYFVWSSTIKELGAVRASNYIFIMPVITLVTSVLILDERMSYTAITGAFLILTGLYISEKKSMKIKQTSVG
ncbi:MAG: DMT family transporter [Bacteroidales bacterium]|nr:DMT family transporter [Bacteroidales bacterium]